MYALLCGLMNPSPIETQTSMGYLSTMSMGGGLISGAFFLGFPALRPVRAAVLGLRGGGAAGASTTKNKCKITLQHVKNS